MRFCRASGASQEALRLLPGGMGRTWRAGGVVLKPVDHLPEHDWVCSVFAGWSAHEWVEGEDAAVREQPDVVRVASEAFHAAVRALERPAFLDDRDDPWTFGDRVAWENVEPQGCPPTLGLLREGLAEVRPVDTPEQVVHGDIGGNVLHLPGQPPAVIDWPPYFRPAGWALAIAAGDAICWDEAPLALLDDWADVPEWDQLLLRAVLYRIATRGRSEALGENATSSEQYVEQRRPSLEAILDRVRA